MTKLESWQRKAICDEFAKHAFHGMSNLMIAKAGLEWSVPVIKLAISAFKSGIIFQWRRDMGFLDLNYAAFKRRVALAKDFLAAKQSLTSKPETKNKPSRNSRCAFSPKLNATTQTKKNRECTDEKSGHHSRRCETRVHASAERQSLATMRAGKRRVNHGSPKPADPVNSRVRNAKHERRSVSGVTPQRIAQSRPIRQAPSPRQATSRTQPEPGRRPKPAGPTR